MKHISCTGVRRTVHEKMKRIKCILIHINIRSPMLNTQSFWVQMRHMTVNYIQTYSLHCGT
jgi:hypothetical protein